MGKQYTVTENGIPLWLNERVAIAEELILGLDNDILLGMKKFVKEKFVDEMYRGFGTALHLMKPCIKFI